MEIESESESELELECSLCKDIFRDPKTLGCLHSFCLECLEIYVERNYSNRTLGCPICRTQIQKQLQLSNLPTDAFLLHSLNVRNSLKNRISQQNNNNQGIVCSDGENEATFYCLDCEQHFCDICTNSHKNFRLLKNHQLILIEEMKNQTQYNSIPKPTPKNYCQIHKEKEIDLLCNDCKLPLCSLCVPRHASHKISTLPSTIGNEKQLLTNLIKKVFFFFSFYSLFPFLFLFQI